MAPKVKITKEKIIETASNIIRENGSDALNARAIAASLGCSTQPIFSNFKDMDELQGEVILDSYNLYLDYISNEINSGKYPKYKSMGMAYIRFAIEQRELFKLLFMRDRTGEDTSPAVDFVESARIIMESTGLSYEKAMLMHLEIWTCVHGIGVMLATSFLTFDWDTISNMLTDVYQGIRARHLAGEKK